MRSGRNRRNSLDVSERKIADPRSRGICARALRDRPTFTIGSRF